YKFLLKKKYKESIILGVLAGSTLVAIFLTFSRAAILMLIVGAITFFVLINKKKLIMFILIAIIIFFILASFKFYDENMNLLREASSVARLTNYAVALKVISDHPLIGVGFDSYRYTKDLYGLKHDWTNAPSHADAGVDNSFLFVLATTGFVGLLAYLWLWLSVLQRAFYLRKQKQIGAVVVISSVFALFINALFLNSLFYAPLMLWMWVIISLMED
ncbi:MAG TPA: O-antigen ligase family protein, partial [Patescibacteria group bacterium]